MMSGSCARAIHPNTRSVYILLLLLVRRRTWRQRFLPALDLGSTTQLITCRDKRERERRANETMEVRREQLAHEKPRECVTYGWSHAWMNDFSCKQTKRAPEPFGTEPTNPTAQDMTSSSSSSSSLTLAWLLQTHNRASCLWSLWMAFATLAYKIRCSPYTLCWLQPSLGRP